MRSKVLALGLALVMVLALSGAVALAQYQDGYTGDVFFTMSAFSLNINYEPHVAFPEFHDSVAEHQYFTTVAFEFWVDAQEHMEHFHLDVWVEAGDGYWADQGQVVATGPTEEGQIGFKYEYDEFVELGPDQPYNPPDEPSDEEWKTIITYLPLVPTEWLFEHLSTFRWEAGTPNTHHVLYVKGLAHEVTPNEAAGRILFHFNARENGDWLL